MRRGPHDHLEAIIYMSCATPRKTKGTADWLGPGRAGLASGRPPRPPGPWSRRSRRSRRRRRASQAASRPVSSFGRRAFACHAGHSPRRRDHVGEWSRRSDDEGSGPLAKRGGRRHCQDVVRSPTPGSFSFGSPAPSTQPAVVFTPRDPGPSSVVPVAGAVAARWLPSWFRARPPSRLSDPFETCSGTSGG